MHGLCGLCVLNQRASRSRLSGSVWQQFKILNCHNSRSWFRLKLEAQHSRRPRRVFWRFKCIASFTLLMVQARQHMSISFLIQDLSHHGRHIWEARSMSPTLLLSVLRRMPQTCTRLLLIPTMACLFNPSWGKAALWTLYSQIVEIMND